MRLFILIALFVVPTTAVQFYSENSFALTSKTVEQETLFDKAALPKRTISNRRTFIDDDLNSNRRSTGQAENKSSKRVKLIKGKKSHKGMNFLSVFLLIKDKKR